MSTHEITLLLTDAVPIIAFLLVIALGIGYTYSLKGRKMRQRDELFRDEVRRRTDELNQRISRMDNLQGSPTETSVVMEEVQKLREELLRMRRDMGKEADTGSAETAPTTSDKEAK